MFYTVLDTWHSCIIFLENREIIYFSAKWMTQILFRENRSHHKHFELALRRTLFTLNSHNCQLMFLEIPL